MSKEYKIGVWDLTFYRIDENGKPERNSDGQVIIYDIHNYDVSHLADQWEYKDLDPRNPDIPDLDEYPPMEQWEIDEARAEAQADIDNDNERIEEKNDDVIR